MTVPSEPLRHVLVNNTGLRRKHRTTRGEPCRGSGQPADPWGAEK